MASALFIATVVKTVEGFLLPFARHFRGRGMRVDAMAKGISQSAECRAAFDRVWDIDWSRNPGDVSNFSKAPRLIRAVVAEQGYDLVHVHTPVAAFVTRYALRKKRRQGRPKVIYTAHGFHFFKGGHRLGNGVFLALERIAGRWTDYLVVINREDEEAARRYQIVPADRVQYMPGIGVDTGWFDPARVLPQDVARVRGELGLAPGQPLFLVSAEFTPNKRHVDVVTAFARLNHPSAHLALAATGPLLSHIQALVSELRLSDRVHFLGFRNDMRELIRASTALLLPSAREGLSRSVMEALSLEVPVAGSDIRGTRELLSDDCGLLFNFGDVDGLQRAMSWILDNPAAAQAMARRGRLKMVERFDTKIVVRAHEKLYARALVTDQRATQPA